MDKSGSDISESDSATSFFKLRNIHQSDANIGLNALVVSDEKSHQWVEDAATVAAATFDCQDSMMDNNDFKRNSTELTLDNCSKDVIVVHEELEMLKPEVSRTIFVGNLDFRATEFNIRRFFNKFGSVKNVYLVKKHGNKTFRRIAFVKFTKIEFARKALQASEQETTMNNRPLRVFPARDKKPKESFQRDRDNFSKISETSVELNDDVFLLIFKYLNPEELLNIEDVSIRWRQLAFTAWASTRSLSFKDCFSPFQGHVVNDGFLKSLLRRCGSSLKSLDVSSISRLLTSNSIKNIAKFCPNLIELNFSGLESAKESMVLLANSCCQLKKVTLGSCGTIGENGVWSLLNKCQDLEYVDISDNGRITGQCFHRFGPNVRVLKLNRCQMLNSRGFQKIAERCSNVVELYLSSCVQLTDEYLKMICLNCKKITKLDLGGNINSLYPYGLRQIKHLINLEELHLSRNKKVDDLVLAGVSENCHKLKVLDISGCSSIMSDVAIEPLEKCSELSTLNISYLPWNNDSLVKVAIACPLEKLVCRGGLQLTDTEYKSVIDLCPRLQLFDISGCNRVSSQIVQYTLNVLNNRENDLKLELVVGGTAIYSVTTHKHPLLVLNQMDLCNRALLAEFVEDYEYNDDIDYDFDDDDDDYDVHPDFDYDFDDFEREYVGYGPGEFEFGEHFSD